MKFQNILLLLTACLLAGSCSDDDNDGAWFLPRTLQVMDAKTDAPRANEPLTLNFIGDDGELYSHRHTTDENGCIHFKGSTRGSTALRSATSPVRPATVSIRPADSGDEAPIIMTVEPLAKEFRSAIVITGMLADAKGSDTNNEYIQFMALEEIDFAQTPYCVIACRNNKVNAKGWVQGSYVTYKFNLTSGRAAKGTFFYVGGVNKRLNGNSSADISGANWICSVDYNTQAGADGIGDKTTGFLHNYNSNGNKNIADGIAVFKGTEVDEKECPRSTRSSTAPPLPRTSTTRPVTATGFPTTIFTARRTSCRASVSPSSGREPIRSSFPTAATMPGSSFSSAAVLRRAVTIAAVRLSAGSWPPMLRDRSPTSKAGTALRLISDSGRGARCASSLSGLPEKSPFRKERAFWNIFCRFNTRISPPARRSGSDRAS